MKVSSAFIFIYMKKMLAMRPATARTAPAWRDEAPPVYCAGWAPQVALVEAGLAVAAAPYTELHEPEACTGDLDTVAEEYEPHAAAEEAATGLTGED